MAAEIHAGDVGTVLTITIHDENDAVVDLTDATVQLKFLRPSLTTETVDASVVGDGTTGAVTFTTTTPIFDRPGRWQVQAIVAFGSVTKWFSSILQLEVAKNL